MALTSQQRGWCVLEFNKTNSVVTGQRAFKRKFNVDPPTNKSILKWHRNFIERGCICDQRKEHSGRPSVSEQVVDRVRESFLRSPRKSTRRASRELMAGTLSVCDTTWNCTSLCNCSHQFCKNIPVSFDFITTWNQGVFLCSPCILHRYQARNTLHHPHTMPYAWTMLGKATSRMYVSRTNGSTCMPVMARSWHY